MSFDAWLTVAVILIMIVGLIKDVYPADVLTFSALCILTVCGVVGPEDAIKGFSNKGMITVALLFPIAYAAQASGVLSKVAGVLIGKATKQKRSLLRMMLPVFALSTFLNNTPVVAMFSPTVRDWAAASKISPSKFLIPVSYASILGGICTLIGTSTNLVANGMLISAKGMSLKMFDFAYVGIPCAFFGFLYMIFIGRRLLPDNKDMLAQIEADESEFIFEMYVEKDADIIGKTISEGNLRKLHDIFAVGISRKGAVISPIRPDEIVCEGDIIFFSGKKSSIGILSSVKGLVPHTHEADDMKLLMDSRKNNLIEAVVSVASSLVNKKIKDINFRGKYDAVVLAIKRDGRKLDAGIGGTVLKAGDTVLLLAGEDFAKRVDSGDFYLLSKTVNSKPTNSRMIWITSVSIAMMIILSALNVLDIFNGAMLVFAILLISRTITASEARRSVELNVLVVIASSFGLGMAIEKTGVASVVADFILRYSSSMGLVGALAAVSLVVTVFTELITNNAAVALIFPVAMSVADKASASPLPFAMAVAISASASFATPIGYQTNLMVQGPGGYKFSDYLKVGLPMNLIYLIVSVICIPVFFKF